MHRGGKERGCGAAAPQVLIASGCPVKGSKVWPCRGGCRLPSAPAMGDAIGWVCWFDRGLGLEGGCRLRQWGFWGDVWG